MKLQFVPTHVEHYFDISMLEGLDLNIQQILLLSGIRGYFNDPQIIYLELIRMLWKNAQMKD